LQQAEFFVQFSKEAKQYQQQKAKQSSQLRTQQLTDFVKELYRVYLKITNPTEQQLDSYVQSLLTSQRSLQEVEGMIVQECVDTLFL
jgi:hypothetical protein